MSMSTAGTMEMAIGGTTALRTMPATMRIHGGMATKTGLATRPRARPKLPPPLHLLMKGNFVKLSGQNRWQNPSPWKPNGLGQGLSPASPASPGLARDCPGRGAGYGGKGKFKGKSKYGYATEMDAYYAKGKSKSKGKGKSKKGMYLNADAVWKGKGNGPDWGSRSVNAYAASTDYFMGGLELSPTMDMASATTSTARPERGMIDCGATASAAPAAVVKGLIASILEKDHGARGDIESNSRPYFRFGDGR